MIELQKKQKEDFIKKYLIVKIKAITQRNIMIANLILDDVPGDKIVKQLNLINQLKTYIKKIHLYSTKIENNICSVTDLLDISKSLINTQEDINKEYREIKIFNEKNQNLIEEIIENYKKEVLIFESYYNSPEMVMPADIKKIAVILMELDSDLIKDIEDII